MRSWFFLPEVYPCNTFLPALLFPLRIRVCSHWPLQGWNHRIRIPNQENGFPSLPAGLSHGIQAEYFTDNNHLDHDYRIDAGFSCGTVQMRGLVLRGIPVDGIFQLTKKMILGEQAVQQDTE
jgi:hypothetical protein